MADLFRFVDGVGSVRLDMNSDVGWHVLRGIEIGRAPVERTFLSQMPYDGAVMAASRRDVVEMTFSLLLARYKDTNNTLRTADEIIDALDDLRVELDRETNIIEYQPDGATSSFLIDTYRADAPTLLAGYAINPFVLRGGVVEISLMRAPNLRGAGQAI